MITKKLHEHLSDELEYYSFGQAPILLNKSGSTVPRDLWKSLDNVKVETLIKGSENWNETPLKKFYEIIDKNITTSKNVVVLARKLSPEDTDKGDLDAIEDEIVELFFT